MFFSVSACHRIIGVARDLWGSSPTPAKQVPCVCIYMYTLSLLAIEVEQRPTAVLVYHCV